MTFVFKCFYRSFKFQIWFHFWFLYYSLHIFRMCESPFVIVLPCLTCNVNKRLEDKNCVEIVLITFTFYTTLNCVILLLLFFLRSHFSIFYVWFMHRSVLFACFPKWPKRKLMSDNKLRQNKQQQQHPHQLWKY